MATEHHKFRGLLVVGALLAAGYFFTRPSASGLVGKVAPEIYFKSEQGVETQLADFKGRGILLNFWAEWCGPCLEEMPALRKLEDALSQDLVVLAFNIDGKKTPPHRNFPSRLINNFEFSDLEPYRIRAIPISVLIDKSGVVKRIYVGPRDWGDPQLLEAIRENIAF